MFTNRESSFACALFCHRLEFEQANSSVSVQLLWGVGHFHDLVHVFGLPIILCACRPGCRIPLISFKGTSTRCLSLTTLSTMFSQSKPRAMQVRYEIEIRLFLSYFSCLPNGSACSVQPSLWNRESSMDIHQRALDKCRICKCKCHF